VGNSGSTPASATLLFGFLIIFVALFSAFLLLGFLWQFQRRRRAAQATLLLEFDENGRSYGDGVPKLWEVWIQDEPNHWEWENIRVSPTPRTHHRYRYLPWRCRPGGILLTLVGA
jgi:hypothetical protein